MILASPGKFWQTPVWLFFMSLCLMSAVGTSGSPTIASHFIQMATDSASWHCCTLCLQGSLNLFWSCSRFLIHHSEGRTRHHEPHHPSTSLKKPCVDFLSNMLSLELRDPICQYSKHRVKVFEECFSIAEEWCRDLRFLSLKFNAHVFNRARLVCSAWTASWKKEYYLQWRLAAAAMVCYQKAKLQDQALTDVSWFNGIAVVHGGRKKDNTSCSHVLNWTHSE